MDSLTMFMLFFSTLLLMDAGCSGSSAKTKTKSATSNVHATLPDKEVENKGTSGGGDCPLKERNSLMLADTCEKTKETDDLLEDGLNTSEGQEMEGGNGMNYPKFYEVTERNPATIRKKKEQKVKTETKKTSKEGNKNRNKNEKVNDYVMCNKLLADYLDLVHTA